MRVSAKMESPPVTNDLRFMVALPPFGNSLKHGYKITALFSLREIKESVLHRIQSYAGSVSGHIHNHTFQYDPDIRNYVRERLSGFIQIQADHAWKNRSTGAD
jgi:hypothetical protein